MKLLLLLLLPTLSWGAMPTKAEQFKISLNMVYLNSTRPDVKPGMVVASPSRSNPDYYFDWVRDTALTMRSMIDYYEKSKDLKVKRLIYTWIDAEAYRQTLPTFSGLGEPKYNIDGSGYTGPWGRPQNDGPALRAIAMIKWARIMLAENNHSYVIKKLYIGMLPANSVIKKDLEYTAHNWNTHSFDLWEEEKGLHFYTLLSQQVALQEGAKLASELQDHGAAAFYKAESEKIARKLKSEFVSSSVGILVTTQKSAPLGYKNSGLDVAPLLALNHTAPYQSVFSMRDPAVLRYISVLAKVNGDLYGVNKKYSNLGVAIGRYPEDRYDGYETSRIGNPWFLATLALGEYSCLAQQEMARKGTLTKSMQKNFNDVLEGQINRALFHSDRNGHMSEQFNHDNGTMQGATDLTWSHNAFMTVMMRCKLI